MSKNELEETIKRIKERKPYVDKYYKELGSKPQWIIDEKKVDKSGYKEELIHFEDWLLIQKRDERINKLLGGAD
jgi:hypothetical protein